MSVVAGLLAMQAGTAGNEDIARAVRDAGHRVQTIASVHDRLLRNTAVRTVGPGPFLHDLPVVGRFIPKPYDPGSVASAIHEMMAA